MEAKSPYAEGDSMADSSWKSRSSPSVVTSNRNNKRPSYSNDDESRSPSHSSASSAFKREGYSAPRQYQRDEYSSSRNSRPDERSSSSSSRTFNRDNEEYSNSAPRRSFRRDGEEGSYGRNSKSVRYGGGSSYSSYRDKYSRNQYETEEKTEPVYGYYDGDHLYGVSPVRLALLANRRRVDELIMQAEMSLEDKKDSKAALEIIEICQLRNIPIRKFPKHDLNMMSDNRPHQGFILRSKPLDFVDVKQLEKIDRFAVTLVLDEIKDPQNFGALLRSSYFLGVEKVIICAKNSCPLSPVVSKASAGAMELMTIYSTDNLMRFLDASKENGWKVVGTDLSDKSIPLSQVPLQSPSILVLGNEGQGIRTNILRRCDYLVKIPSSAFRANANTNNALPIVPEFGGVEDGVDSLNVSVSGGIILHHMTTASSSHVQNAMKEE